MMKPGIGAYDRFKAMFDEAAKKAGKQYFLIPYFIAAHPGTTDEDMLNLALWLKRNRYRADQVQTFLPSPMAVATAMYHTGAIRCAASGAAARRRSSRSRVCASAACTRPSCATTTPRTGRCCARR